MEVQAERNLRITGAEACRLLQASQHEEIEAAIQRANILATEEQHNVAAAEFQAHEDALRVNELHLDFDDYVNDLSRRLRIYENAARKERLRTNALREGLSQQLHDATECYRNEAAKLETELQSATDRVAVLRAEQR